MPRSPGEIVRSTVIFSISVQNLQVRVQGMLWCLCANAGCSIEVSAVTDPPVSLARLECCALPRLFADARDKVISVSR